MNFSSDNAYGASARNSQSRHRCRGRRRAVLWRRRHHPARDGKRLNEIFGREVAAFPVLTGTAANSLALATLCPPHGAIFCHAGGHIAVDECAAPEFFTHGAKAGAAARARPARSRRRPSPRRCPAFSAAYTAPSPVSVSITQLTELGTAYAPDEIAAICRLRARPWHARAYGRRALRQCAGHSGLRGGRHHLARGCRCALLRRHQERRAGRRGGDLLRSRKGRRFRIPPQEGRASAVEDALRLGAARRLSGGRVVARRRRRTPMRWHSNWRTDCARPRA